MDVEQLSRSELLTLFSVLEGELEAQDLVIEVLKAQRRDTFVQERYRTYRPTDPFLALQRDGEALQGHPRWGGASPSPSPLAVLRLVVAHCRRMQEKMVAQLAAAECRHRKVIADLEEEQRRHAQDAAEGDDVTYMLEKERERLLQQLEFERAHVRRLEKEQKKLLGQLEEERVQQRQRSISLSVECQRAGARALEEGRRGAELSRSLEREQEAVRGLRAELEAERGRALRVEAELEERLAELDTECEQLRARLRREEGRGREMEAELEGLREQGGATTGSQSDASDARAKVNGQHTSEEEPTLERRSLENGHAPMPFCSPVSSPVLPKRSGFQSSYQASITQRFQAARHKFQTPAEPDVSGSQTLTNANANRDPSPVRQLARHTVTQVLSRFTSQQGGAKTPSPSSSPFGTDYRSLRSPTMPRADPPPIPPKKPGLGQSPPPTRATHFPDVGGFNSNQNEAKEQNLALS